MVTKAAVSRLAPFRSVTAGAAKPGQASLAWTAMLTVPLRATFAQFATLTSPTPGWVSVAVIVPSTGGIRSATVTEKLQVCRLLLASTAV